MGTELELFNSFDRQINFIRDQLHRQEYGNAVKSTELLATYLKCKVNELNEKESE